MWSDVGRKFENKYVVSCTVLARTMKCSTVLSYNMINCVLNNLLSSNTLLNAGRSNSYDCAFTTPYTVLILSIGTP